MTTYLGKVSYDLAPFASRVPVTVFDKDIRLLVKATFDDWPRNVFKKDVTVEIEKPPYEIREFRVTKVFEEVKKKPFVHYSHIYVPDAGRGQAEIMAQLGDRVTVVGKEDKVVRFWISSRYSKDLPTQLAMGRVLVKALKMEEHEADALLTRGGFWVVCRESQFARFLIKRNEEGLPNLFQDLRVEYYTAGKTRPEIDVSRR